MLQHEKGSRYLFFAAVWGTNRHTKAFAGVEPLKMLGGRSAEQAEHEQEDSDGDEREPKRAKQNVPEALARASATSTFRISVVTMTGTAIAINNAAADDSILCIKQRVFAANRKLFVRRQRLMYTAGPHGMNPLADDETLGGAGVVQDGSAELDVLLADLTHREVAALGRQVLLRSFFL